MDLIEIDVVPKRTEEIVKETFWLAWQACGGPLGMGFLQDNPSADKEAVFLNIMGNDDYPGESRNRLGDVYADYVFGRMKKFGLRYNPEEGKIWVWDTEPRLDYQAWCHKYENGEAMVRAAIKSIMEAANEQKEGNNN